MSIQFDALSGADSQQANSRQNSDFEVTYQRTNSTLYIDPKQRVETLLEDFYTSSFFSSEIRTNLINLLTDRNDSGMVYRPIILSRLSPHSDMLLDAAESPPIGNLISDFLYQALKNSNRPAIEDLLIYTNKHLCALQITDHWDQKELVRLNHVSYILLNIAAATDLHDVLDPAIRSKVQYSLSIVLQDIPLKTQGTACHIFPITIYWLLKTISLEPMPEYLPALLDCLDYLIPSRIFSNTNTDIILNGLVQDAPFNLDKLANLPIPIEELPSIAQIGVEALCAFGQNLIVDNFLIEAYRWRLLANQELGENVICSLIDRGFNPLYSLFNQYLSNNSLGSSLMYDLTNIFSTKRLLDSPLGIRAYECLVNWFQHNDTNGRLADIHLNELEQFLAECSDFDQAFPNGRLAIEVFKNMSQRILRKSVSGSN